jgi:hypothetical protein
MHILHPNIATIMFHEALVATLSTLFMSELELEVFHHSVQYFMFMSWVGKQSTLYVGYDEVERP